MTRSLHCSVLGCALALLTLPAFAAKAPAAKHSHKPTMQAKALDKAQLAFQRDLVSVLAPRADAEHLLAAAILARPLFNQPPSNSFHHLIARAARADAAGAAVNWVRLADCDAKAENCPNDDALKQLLSEAPDNAAVWLIKLGTDARDMKKEAAREDLRQAAAAKLYDDYTGSSLQVLANSVGILPPPADSFDPTHAGGATGMQTMMIYGLASTQPQPSLQLVAKLCDPDDHDASIRSDCLKLAKVLEWGSSPLARSLGLHLSEVLSDDPAQQQAAKDARRDLVWQVQNFGQLLARVQDDPTLARDLLNLARNGGTEMSLQLAALRGHGIAVNAPIDWQPSKAE
ncbi:MAG TPA: hypothetical protein VN043_07540 [Rhodanobacter sp.]|nr:hypothetical protein [Rhodanobacter sp.]